VDTIDLEEHESISATMRNWLAHPGTQLMVKKLKDTADKALLEYDEAIFTGNIEKAQRIAITRWFINKELPRIVEFHINPPPPAPKRWKFWEWFNQRCN
jgi:GTP cyclohydrolase I